MSARDRLGEALYPLALLAVGIVTLREASGLAPAPFDPLGPKTFPVWMAWGLIALSLIMLGMLALGRDLGRSTTAMVFGLDGEGEHRARPFVPVLILVLTAAYIAAIAWKLTSFRVSTGLFVFATAMLLSPPTKRSLAIAVAAALIVALSVDGIFRVLFGLDLP